MTILGPLTRRGAIGLIGSIVAGSLVRAAQAADGLETPAQPYFASVKRALQAMAKLGAPVAPRDAALIEALSQSKDGSAVRQAEAILDKYTLARLAVGADGSLSIDAAGAPRTLVEQGWRMFLVRIDNGTGSALPILFGRLQLFMSQITTQGSAQRASLYDTVNNAPFIEQLWLQAEMLGTTLTRLGDAELPLLQLSGLFREYHVLQLYSRDRGSRAATLNFRVPTAQDSVLSDYFSSASRSFDFQCVATKEIPLHVRDSDGLGCMAALTIKDTQGRLYPPAAMRLAPDMSFHEHIYRADGETLRLPDGDYVVESWRGPEYLRGRQNLRVGQNNDSIDIRLQRWIDPSRWGWYSGDPHIHAAGCLHYQTPTEGVAPETMIRHVRGEALSIGQVLTWGPSWYYQKQFFRGRAESPAAGLEHPDLQAANNATWKTHAAAKDAESLLRYDIEVSGFPSSICGHLSLLRLKNQDYSGTKLIEDWPSWNLPILKWAKAQGSVTGYTHCAPGMVVQSTALPNYEIPPFDSVGANEAIVDVTHGVLDFLSGCNLFPVAELNAWYHMLNCGFRLTMVGETDYPCLSGERPGFGRTYVRLDQRPLDNAGYEAWIEGLRQGRLYCGDGRSHFLEFRVQDQSSGEDLILGTANAVRVQATVAARLDVDRVLDIETLRMGPLQRWHLENARIGNSREVAVELIVNGVAVDRTVVVADGTPQKIHFDATVAHSSWVALRILTSAHTHPVFVQVGGKPIRASKASAQWCRDCVNKLWEVKSPFIRESERAAAAEAFDHARKVYKSIADECEHE